MNEKLIIRHREITSQIASLQNELEQIESSPAYARELEWANDLEKLMATYGKSADDVAHLLTAGTAPTKQGVRGPKVGTPRKRISYKNPYTGDVVNTAGGNNRILKEWKTQYPKDDIKTWII